MEPAQVAGEVLGGDAAAGAEEALQPRMAIVDGLDVQFAPHPLAGGLVEDLMADAQGGGAGGGAGAAIGDQQSIGADDRLEGRREGGCGNRRQHGAEGCARAVGRPQHRHQFVRQSSLGGLAAALAGFSIRRIGIRSALLGPLPGPIALAAPQDEGLIRLDDAAQLPGTGFDRFKKAMTPAEGGAHPAAAALGRRLDRTPLGQAGAERQPLFLAMQPGQAGPGQRSEGSTAGLTQIALPSPRLAVGHPPGRSTARAAAIFANAQFDRGKGGFPSSPTRQNPAGPGLLLLRQRIRPRQPNLKRLPLHRLYPPAFPRRYTISIHFANRAIPFEQVPPVIVEHVADAVPGLTTPVAVLADYQTSTYRSRLTGLALQLRSTLEMSLSGDGLVASPPGGPRDDEGGFDAPL